MDSEFTALTFNQSYSKEDDRTIGVFVPPSTETWRFCEEKFDLALEHEARSEEYVAALNEIIELEPAFLDAYAHLGNLFLGNEYIDDAEDWYSKGLETAMALVPSGFTGTIAWADLDNRPFLRLHHGYILCQLRNKKFKKAVKLMEEHLSWNISDNIGVRYLIGDACLMCGMTQKAKKYLSETYAEDPPNAYSLALLEFKKKKYVEAATMLRFGIATNQYIAEALTGRIELNPHFFWHGTSFGMPETAESYLEHGGYELWLKEPGAIDFCDWLFNCSEVLRERAELMELREGLTYESDSGLRGFYSQKQFDHINAIDSSLSKKIIKKHVDRHGNDVWPWERPL